MSVMWLSSDKPQLSQNGHRDEPLSTIIPNSLCIYPWVITKQLIVLSVINSAVVHRTWGMCSPTWHRAVDGSTRSFSWGDYQHCQGLSDAFAEKREVISHFLERRSLLKCSRSRSVNVLEEREGRSDPDTETNCKSIFTFDDAEQFLIEK